MTILFKISALIFYSIFSFAQVPAVLKLKSIEVGSSKKEDFTLDKETTLEHPFYSIVVPKGSKCLQSAPDKSEYLTCYLTSDLGAFGPHFLLQRDPKPIWKLKGNVGVREKINEGLYFLDNEEKIFSAGREMKMMQAQGTHGIVWVAKSTLEDWNKYKPVFETIVHSLKPVIENKKPAKAQ